MRTKMATIRATIMKVASRWQQIMDSSIIFKMVGVKMAKS